MNTVLPTIVPPAVTPLQETLAPLDRSYFDLKVVAEQFVRETGKSFEECQTAVLTALRSKTCTFDDAFYDPPSQEQPLVDQTIVKQITMIEERLQKLSDLRSNPSDIVRSPYGVVMDEFVSAQLLRLRLRNLADVVGQEALRSITIVHSFIPAELLEGPGQLGFSPEAMVSDFLLDLRKALAETGFSYVRLSGWLELALMESPGQNKTDCLDDQWLFRGQDFFDIPDAPRRSYSLHTHMYGVARRCDEWVPAKDITEALEAYFPFRNARLSREFDLTKSPDVNIGRISRYRSKLMGDVEQGREMPSAAEIAANVRFWARCAIQGRDFTIAEDWPEIGPRLSGKSDDIGLLKRVSNAWEDAESAWTDRSRNWATNAAKVGT